MAKPKLTKRGNTWYSNGKAVKPGTSFTFFSFVSILKSLIRAFIIKICRNLNKKVRLRQISCLKVVVISY